MTSRKATSSARASAMQQVEILIKGHIDVEWSGRLAGLAVIHTTDGNTILRGDVVDQPGMYGLLNRLSDMGVRLLSISAADPGLTKVEGPQSTQT